NLWRARRGLCGDFPRGSARRAYSLLCRRRGSFALARLGFLRGANQMERITLTIETGNAAFDDAPASEIARILRAAADRLERGDCFDFPLRDINGNTCGRLVIEGDD